MTTIYTLIVALTAHLLIRLRTAQKQLKLAAAQEAQKIEAAVSSTGGQVVSSIQHEGQKVEAHLGPTEKHLLPVVVSVIGIFLLGLLASDPSLPMLEYFSRDLLHLGILLAATHVLLRMLGGTKFDVVGAVKADPKALAILVSGLLLACAIVMGK